MTHSKGQPFYFDLHDFDREDAMGNAIEPPPKLEFTIKDIEEAKAEAFEEGQKKGYEDSQSGLTKQILSLMQNIRQNGTLLFASEDERKDLYEAEVLHLTYCVFKKLFPLYMEHHGFEELKQTLVSVLNDHRTKNSLCVYVPENLEEETARFMKEQGLMKDGIQLKSKAELHGIMCQVEWTDGGVIHDPEKIAMKTFSILEEALAIRGISVHDREDKEISDESQKDMPSSSLDRDADDIVETKDEGSELKTDEKPKKQKKKSQTKDEAGDKE